MDERAIHHRRSGTAIVAALGLVTLAAALLAAAAAASSAGARTVLTERASVVADAAARHSLALALSHWDPADDSLLVGQSREGALQDDVIESSLPLPVSGARSVQRIGRTLFALGADVRVGSAPWIARRRVRLLVSRGSTADTGAALAPPVPIGRWSSADLY
jgi:hypothetical protein